MARRIGGRNRPVVRRAILKWVGVLPSVFQENESFGGEQPLTKPNARRKVAGNSILEERNPTVPRYSQLDAGEIGKRRVALPFKVEIPDE